MKLNPISGSLHAPDHTYDFSPWKSERTRVIVLKKSERSPFPTASIVHRPSCFHVRIVGPRRGGSVGAGVIELPVCPIRISTSPASSVNWNTEKLVN